MKRFLQLVSLYSAVMAAFVFAGLFLLPNAKTRASMLGALPQKLATARAMESPKIILAGGSNISFGMDSKLLSEKTGMPVINLGVYGALGLKQMLDHARRVMKPGDTVVVFPEYEQLMNRKTFLGNGDGLVSSLCEVDREGFRELSLEQWTLLAGPFISYAQTKWIRPKNWWDRRARPWYAANSFNEFGDEIGHAGMPHKELAPPSVWKPNATLDPRIGADLKNFTEETRAKKINCVFLPSVYPASTFDARLETLHRLETAMAQNNTPFAAPCERYRFADTDFFDTVYHLAYDAAPERARRVAGDLRAAIQPPETP